jgi:hypothetical protein
LTVGNTKTGTGLAGAIGNINKSSTAAATPAPAAQAATNVD